MKWFIDLTNKIIEIIMSGHKKRFDKKKFFDGYRNRFGSLTQKQVNALDLFLDEVNKNFDYFTHKQWAYVLATTFHETNETFEPVREAYWLSEEWRKKNLRYYPYYGRGFVQITWEENYAKFSKLLNVDLVNNPDLTMRFNNSFYILIKGTKDGLFTGRKLSDYVNDSKTDYINARRVINGTDKASKIAREAEIFESILKL